MESFLEVETLVIELLLIATLVAIAVRRLRVPYTVALVVVGLLITFGREMQLALSPELVLVIQQRFAKSMVSLPSFIRSATSFVWPVRLVGRGGTFWQSRSQALA